MTAETDLLPSSVAAFTEALKGGRGSLDAWLEVNDEREVAAHVEAYARANVARATAPLQAEIEALRAEVERLTLEMGRLQQQYDERTACMILHRGQALACSDAVRAAYFDESRRADKLWEEVGRLRAEVERLQEIVRPKREDECLTLDHWRMRAYALEANWSRCSRACAIEQTKREQAEAHAERLAEALRNSADALERLAFAIRAPNAHTPQLVELAIAMRAAAIDQARGKGVADA